MRARGTFMQEAVPAGVGAMAAILGLAPEKVKAACDGARAGGEVVDPANYNSPEQTVIAGHAAAVERAMARCKAKGRQARHAAAGVRALPLRADGAGEAAARGGARRGARPRAAVPVVTNVDAEPNTDAGRASCRCCSRR